MTTQLDYICSQCYGVKGMGLQKYYKDTIAKTFDVKNNKIYLGDDVITLIGYEGIETIINDVDINQYRIITSHGDNEIIEHQIWYDDEGNIHERAIQAMKDYTGGDAVLNHYIAILLWSQVKGISRFYSDTSLSPGTVKIYERLRKLGRNVHGPCDFIDSVDSSGQIKSEKPIYYIELQKTDEHQ